MNGLNSFNKSKAGLSRQIIENATPTVFPVAYFGGWTVAVIFSSIFGKAQGSWQAFFLVLICIIGVATMWWRLREVPKRTRALNELRTIHPALINVTEREAFRATKLFIEEERREIIALLKKTLQPFGIKQYSGRLLEGGRFEMYNGEVSPTSNASKIAEMIERFGKEYGIQLCPSYVRGMFNAEICVHVSVLGESLYFYF
ncbi:hypothetical protein KKB69_01200 [Patescibacteria group bacterium]|nr:hypothetical protein [Patescibacteria group bacterium]